MPSLGPLRPILSMSACYRSVASVSRRAEGKGANSAAEPNLQRTAENSRKQWLALIKNDFFIRACRLD